MRLLDVRRSMTQIAQQQNLAKTFKLACLGKGTFVYHIPETQALFTAERF